jgi:REP element-mobilizing transposase RayT
MPRRRRKPRAARPPGIGAWLLTLWLRPGADRLGEVREGVVALSAAGRLVERCWLRTPAVHPGIRLDAHVVMPDHLHALLWLDRPGRPLAAVVGMFKGQTNRVARQYLWERGYACHHVRDADELSVLRRHVAANPARWSRDPENRDGRTEAGAADAETALGWRP